MSKNTINVRPIEDVINSVRREMADSLESTRKRYEERIKAIEQHRRLLPLLDAEGIPLDIYQWDDLSCLDISLGLRPETKKGRSEFAKKLQVIRQVLDCPLKVHGKGLHDARKKLVRFYLRPEQYPNVTVTYETKLPKNAKCRIVRRKVRFTDANLVCEL
jgi:hypothetical protein